MPNKRGEMQALPKRQAQKETHIGVDGGGTIRAGIFGVNDGLVSNTALILGVAGATSDAKVIIIAGTAGLLAGAFSMAAGEWVSMQSQRELFEREIEIERREIREDPEAELAELAAIYRKRGMPAKQAHAAASAVMKNPQSALDVHVREELGLNPDELGSPWKAAGSSFVAFMIGGIIPLAPFFFMAGSSAVLLASALAAAALFAVGAALGGFTRRNWAITGLRMLLIGGTAALVTHFVGQWLGVTVG